HLKVTCLQRIRCFGLRPVVFSNAFPMVYVPRRAAVGSCARSVDVSASACPQPGVLPIRRNLHGRLLSYEQLSHDWKNTGPVPRLISLHWHTVGRTSGHGANLPRPRTAGAVQPP